MRYLAFILLAIFANPFTSTAQCYDCDDVPFLGIYSNGVSKKKANALGFENTEGSYITGVIGNTAAEQSGLQPFDYVFGIDEYRTDYGRSLTSILRKYDPGDEVTVHFYRKGKKEQLKLTLGTREDAEYNKRSKREDPFLGVEQRSKGWEDEYNGVKVNVVSNSTAKAIGLENGDIISQINGFPIFDWTDLGTAIDMTEVGNTMEITFIREGQKRKASGRIKSYAESKYGTSSNASKDYQKDKSYRYDSDEDEPSHAYGDLSVSGGRAIDGVQVNLKELSTEAASRLATDYQIDLSNGGALTANNLKIETNETKGIFKLTFNLSANGPTVVDIFNSQGRNIYNYDLGNFSGDFEDTVDLAQNGLGTYYLKISQAGKTLLKALELTKE